LQRQSTRRLDSLTMMVQRRTPGGSSTVPS
jgi:hypothetical protein